MSLYLLCRLREFDTLGFSGFEGRYYSLFSSLEDDMGRAADLQTLLYALAFKYMAEGKLVHAHIPDDPAVESERRQIFFGAAIGIPTFYVRKNTGNLFLKKIIEQVKRARPSRRYPGYLRIYNVEYCKVLVKILQTDAADLIEMLHMKETVEDLWQRLDCPDRYSVSGKLTDGILHEANAKSPMDVSAGEFNKAAERYYQDRLRKYHVFEAFRIAEEDFRALDADHHEAILRVLKQRDLFQFLADTEKDVMADRATEEDLRRLIHLTLISLDYDVKQSQVLMRRNGRNVYDPAPVC